MKFHAVLYGRSVRSDISLSVHGRASTPTSEKRAIRVRRALENPKKGARWYHSVLGPKGEVLGRFGRKAKYFLVDFPKLASFRLNSSGSEIEYLPARGTRESDIAALVLTQILPLACQLGGDEVLHAAMIRYGREAVGFLGRQGQGKSTLTAVFHALDFGVLSDDAAPVAQRGKRFWTTPSIPEIRLAPRTGARFLDPALPTLPALKKIRTGIGRGFERRALPLRALFCLETAKSLSIERLPPGEACRRILASSFRVDTEDSARLREELLAIAALVECVPVFCLKYPRGLGRLPGVARAVLRKLENPEGKRR